jgi:hypothetical protein
MVWRRTRNRISNPVFFLHGSGIQLQEIKLLVSYTTKDTTAQFDCEKLCRADSSDVMDAVL